MLCSVVDFFGVFFSTFVVVVGSSSSGGGDVVLDNDNDVATCNSKIR